MISCERDIREPLSSPSRRVGLYVGTLLPRLEMKRFWSRFSYFLEKMQPFKFFESPCKQ